MIRFRKEHRILRENIGECSLGFPDISFHSVKPWCDQYNSYDRYVGVMFAGQVPGKRPEIIYIASNSYWEELTITLPELPEYMNWSLKVNTIDSQTDLEYKHYTKDFKIAPRTVMVFSAQS